MKKLIEFQEVKHGEVLDVISKFRAENNVTFSEAVRRLVLLSQNGNCVEPEMITYNTEDVRIDELTQKVDKLKDIILKHIKKGHSEDEE